MDDLIKVIREKINKGYEADFNNLKLLSKNRRSLFIKFYDKDNEYFVKIIRSNNNVINSYLFNENRIRRELYIYVQLSRKDYKYLKVPKLVGSDSKKILVLEYLKGINDQSFNVIRYPHYKIIDALIEFQYLNINEYNGARDRIIKKINNNVLRIFVLSLHWYRKEVGLIKAMKLIIKYIKLNLSQPKSKKPFLLHNDFHKKNIIIDQCMNPYIIDFCNAAKENKWVLRDVINYSYDVSMDGPIDVDVVNYYIRQLYRKGMNIIELKIRNQVRYILIWRTLISIKYRIKNHKNNKPILNYLDILCDDVKYEKWYMSLGLREI